jgi:hypothetical protein
MIDYMVKQEWRDHAEKMATGDKFNSKPLLKNPGRVR